MSLLRTISAVFNDPPPAMAFELSEAGIAWARMRPKTDLRFHPLAAGVISVSPLRDNVADPDALSAAVREMAPPDQNRRRRDVAVILPDHCARIAVLDFDNFPSDAKEQLSLVRFRMRKSVPFDVESAAVSYHQQGAAGKKCDVVVVIAPLEIVARYEAPFRAAGMSPGLVTTSALAALDLVDAAGGVTVAAKLSGRVLTVLVLQDGGLRLVRSLELADGDMAELAADLYPTFVYIEDQLGVRAERLLLCGFERIPDAAQQFGRELDIPVDLVRSPLAHPGEHNAGLLGYVQAAGAAERKA